MGTELLNYLLILFVFNKSSMKIDDMGFAEMAKQAIVFIFIGRFDSYLCNSVDSFGITFCFRMIRFLEQIREFSIRIVWGQSILWLIDSYLFE